MHCDSGFPKEVECEEEEYEEYENYYSYYVAM